MPRLFLAMLLLCLGGPLWGMSPAPLDSDDIRLSLAPYLGYYEDRDGNLEVADVQRLPDNAFRAITSVNLNLGKNASTWWIKVPLRNSRQHALGGYLEANYALLDRLDIYLLPSAGPLQHQQGGDNYAFDQRPVKVRHLWFPLEVPPGDSTLLLRVQTSSTVFVPLFFSTYAASAAEQETLMGLNGAYYGVLFAMFVYNLFLFMALRERAYFWYLVYIVNIGLLGLSIDGLLFKMLPDQVALQAVSIYIIMFLHGLTSVQFSRHFLNLPQHFPRLDLGMRLLMLGILGSLLSAPLIGMAAWSIISSLAILVVSLILLLAGIYTWSQGLRHGSYYVLAWSVLLVAFVMITSASLGMEVFGVYSSAVVKVGVAIELLTLSLGLADRINQLKEEGFHSREAATRAEMENKAKSRFLAKMSHEIRTPLNGVLGMLQLLRSTPLDNHQRVYLDTINSSGHTLMAVINDILDYARIESGKLSLENIEFDLEQLLSDTLMLFTAQALDKRLRLYISLEGGVPQRISGDPTRLKQVLMNLLGNAVKFTEQGSVTLTVSRRSNSTGQYHLVFAVTDTGIGISESTRGQLFKSFSQGDSSTTRRFGGSGLGLAICKELVEMMGGGIELQSTPGQGTRFAFDIPLHPVNPGDEELTTLLANRTALLCSMDSQGLDCLEPLLRRWGMRTQRCRDPERLRADLEEFTSPPLLVLMEPWPGIGSHWLDNLRPYLQQGQRVLLLSSAGERQAHPDHHQLKLLGLPLPLSLVALRETLLKLYREQPSATLCRLEPAPQRAGKVPCILVAEDNRVNQQVVQGLLKSRGYQVRLVGDGQSVVDEYRRNPSAIQLILMDYEMPELDGLEATRQIRRLEYNKQLPAVPIIALTAHILDEHRQQSLQAGMNDFLGKPLDSQQLFALLDHYLLAEAHATD